MRFPCAAAILLMLPVSAFADVNVTISKSQQRMAVSIDGGPSYVWPVSTGKPGYDTPSGRFQGIRLEEVYYSKKFDDAPMPNSVFFHGGYAIHGTLEERRLGNPVSHGCVRLARPNAALLFAAVREHGLARTHITITDGPIYGAAPLVAGGYERAPQRYGYSADEDDDELVVRRAPPRLYQDTFAPPPSRTRGFEEFAPPPRYRDEPSRRVYWDEPPRRYVAPREQLVPGRVYTEAEIRRVYRENGWRY